MKNGNMWVILFLAIILALLVPLSDNLLESDKAFTHDNLIFLSTDISQ